MNQIPKKIYIGVILWNMLEGIIFFLAGVICLMNSGTVTLGYVAGAMLFLYAIADMYAFIGPNRHEIIDAAIVGQLTNKKLDFGDGTDEEEKKE